MGNGRPSRSPAPATCIDSQYGRKAAAKLAAVDRAKTWAPWDSARSARGFMNVSIPAYCLTPSLLGITAFFATWWKAFKAERRRTPDLDFPAVLLAAFTRWMPQDRSEWGMAMTAELAHFESSSSRWRFALSCLRVAIFPPPRGDVLFLGLAGLFRGESRKWLSAMGIGSTAFAMISAARSLFLNVTMAHLFRASLVVTVLIALTFLPFFPGSYDPLSKPLSGMAWILMRVGLLLVPIGGLWILFCGRSASGFRPPTWLVWMTLGICILIALALILVAFAFGLLMAAGTGAVAGLFIIRLTGYLRKATPISRTAMAFVAMTPILTLLAQLTFIEPIASRARNRVIASSAPLIAQIESFRTRHGAYPVSIFALYGDVKPGVVGVQHYHYERAGDAFNLIFEEPAPSFGLRRFVVYNPHDKQRLTVHETDRLQLDDAGLDVDNAGYTIVEPLSQPHWKLFTFRS